MVPRDLKHQNALASQPGAGATGSREPYADEFHWTGVACFLHSDLSKVSLETSFTVKGGATFSAGLLPSTGSGRWQRERSHSNQTRLSTADPRLQHRLRHVKYYFVSFNSLSLKDVVIDACGF